MRTKYFINKEARKLAREVHREEHLIVKKKIEENHELNDWYYMMASGIYVNLQKELSEIKKLTEELSFQIQKITDSQKEVSKQQKYLWQTLEDGLKFFPEKFKEKIKEKETLLKGETNVL